ncbi:MAG: HAMP domain-containing histidine kinase [Lentisphaeria bacterium]|nr:HAMP domain-containing histidine kinase [Lentisphaeria bacterium]
MFKQNKIIFACASAIVLCCLILGYIALKVARSEQNFRYAELRNSAVKELNSTNNSINNEINVINFELASLLQESVSLEQMYALPNNNPIILNLFLANADGELIYPERNGDFFRRYARLFENNYELTPNLTLSCVDSGSASATPAKDDAEPAAVVDTYEVNVAPEERNVVISQQKLINSIQIADNSDDGRASANRLRVIRYNNQRTDTDLINPKSSAEQTASPGERFAIESGELEVIGGDLQKTDNPESPPALDEQNNSLSDNAIAKRLAQTKKLNAAPNIVSNEKMKRREAGLKSPAYKEYDLSSSRSSAIYAASNSPGDSDAPLLGLVRSTPPARHGPTAFKILSADNTNGFIKYFTDNRYSPLIWVRRNLPEDRESAIFAGVELNMDILQQRIVKLMPRDTPEYFRYELISAAGQVIADSAVGSEQKFELIASIPFAETFFQNWQLCAFLAPAMVPGRSLATALYMQIAVIALIMLLGSILLIYIIRRKMQLVTQRSSFVANVSHELKTPLTSIRMYSELLSLKQHQLSPERQIKYLSVINFESERLSRLIENVLNFNRLEAKKRQYNPRIFILNEKISEICEQWQEILRHDKLELQMVISTPPIRVQFDPDSLTQIIQNLFSNAAKYAATGKRVILTLQLNDDGSCVQILIRDFGPGIPVECRKKLFSNFYRCSNALTDGVGGSGLGLAIARRMTRDQRGDLRLNPNVSPGAEFIVEIPRYDKSNS